MIGNPNAPVNPENIEEGDYIKWEHIGGITNNKMVRLEKVKEVNNEEGSLYTDPIPTPIRWGTDSCYHHAIRRVKLFKKSWELDSIQADAIGDAMRLIR